MSLLTSIKHSGLELFLSYHPVMKKIKKEAKELHKSNILNQQKSTLMQCQKLILNQHGFNDWHHFTQTLKNQYNTDLDNKTFIIKNNYEDTNKYFYLGFDLLFNNHKYQDIQSSKTHRIIYGKNIYTQYDVFFAKQSIKMGHRLFFVDNDNNEDTFPLLIECAKNNNRQNDVIFINKNHHLIFNNFNYFSTSTLVDLFLNLIPNDSNSFSDETISYLTILFMYLKTNPDNVIMLKDIKEQLFSEDFLYNFSDVNNPYYLEVKTKLIKNLENDLPYGNIDILKKSLINLIENLISSGLFTNNPKSYNLNFFPSDGSNRSKIYLFNGDPLITKFFTLVLKNSAQNLLGTPVNNYENLIKHPKISTDIFLRNPLLTKNISIFNAQARSLNISLNFSFSHYQNLESNELQSTIANTLTKIIDPKEKEFLQICNNIHNITNTFNSLNFNFNPYKNKNPVYILYKNSVFTSTIN